MLHTTQSTGGMVVAPHHLAARAGASVLADGGNAIEAMIAAASAIAVVYPHMNGLGGDGFWLIGRAGQPPIAIQACGRAGRGANRGFFRDRGERSVPSRGPLAAITMAGTVGGWASAYDVSMRVHGGDLPLERLLRDAIRYAEDGIPVPMTLATNASRRLSELRDVPGFADLYMRDGRVLKAGDILVQKKLGRTLRRLADAGFEDFYCGELAESMASDLQSAGSPITIDDFRGYSPVAVEPLSIDFAEGRLFNLPPPTQGLASLLILGLYGQKRVESAERDEYVHRLVEATKVAFAIRNSTVTDPDYMTAAVNDFLQPKSIGQLAERISERAAPWPHPSSAGDTVWLGAADRSGLIVSFIQSIYWEFGSGVVLPGTGITWQNRGTSFSLEAGALNALEPGRLPFHTIQPAMSYLKDGRLIAYGTMGGEGQPQTQAAIFSRYVMHGYDLQAAITAPRWLLGRTWGEESTNLKLESRFAPDVVAALRARGHDIDVLGPFEEVMGHAGAVVRHANGLLEGAFDPRSDGAAAAC